MTTFKMMNQDFFKLDRFDGTNFSHKDKLIFLLIRLKISYVLDQDLPVLAKPKSNDNDEIKGECKKMYTEDTF